MLERIWIDDTGLGAQEVQLRRQWYVTAACGGSLHKAGASAWLTRKEAHAFLNASAGLGFAEAFWEAIARSYTEDAALALRIARSKVGRRPREDFAFWRSVARFFCVNATLLETMDDLCAYLAECRRGDPAYSIGGRTLPSLMRRMNEWHHDLAAIARIEGLRRRGRWGAAGTWAADAAWAGSALADWEWAPSSKDAKARGERFFARQLKCAEDLVHESRAMRHGVASYAGKCLAGQASIWSLRRCTKERSDALLTIEMDAQAQAVQMRGLANRLANDTERQVLQRWAKSRGVTLPAV